MTPAAVHHSKRQAGSARRRRLPRRGISVDPLVLAFVFALFLRTPRSVHVGRPDDEKRQPTKNQESEGYSTRMQSVSERADNRLAIHIHGTEWDGNADVNNEYDTTAPSPSTGSNINLSRPIETLPTPDLDPPPDPASDKTNASSNARNVTQPARNITNSTTTNVTSPTWFNVTNTTSKGAPNGGLTPLPTGANHNGEHASALSSCRAA